MLIAASMQSGALARDARPSQALRIIVADDDHDTVRSLSLLLREEGHDVLEVYSGDPVLDATAWYQPDVVILDIGMPGLTGFEVARALRQRLREACPLLIAVTAWTKQSARVLGRLSGFSHYLTKPYSTDELLGILSSLSVSGHSL